jgi:elongation factor P
VVLRVIEADPVTKGQTAASSYKSAVLENGIKTLVPPFIEAGTRVIVSTDDGSYVKRAE